jgi:hypothetical protein
MIFYLRYFRQALREPRQRIDGFAGPLCFQQSRQSVACVDPPVRLDGFQVQAGEEDQIPAFLPVKSGGILKIPESFGFGFLRPREPGVELEYGFAAA